MTICFFAQDLIDLAKAAEYFQLKSVVSWLDSIIRLVCLKATLWKFAQTRGNISHSVMCSRYPGLSPMELVAHLEVIN